MDQQEFQKEMARIEKSNKWKRRKPILIISGLVFLLIAYLNISKYIKKNEEEEKRYQVDKTSFIEDSVWLVNVLSNYTPDKLLPGQLVDLKRKITYNSYASDNSKSHLMNILNSIKVKVDTGTRVLDEFDRVTLVKNITKTIIMDFRDFENYEIKRIYQGYANDKNRKAHNLILKYPSWSTDDCLTIAAGSISIGMTPDMVRESWGRPLDINRTTNASGTSEQWVYIYRYVYFDDGVVTTIQN